MTQEYKIYWVEEKLLQIIEKPEPKHDEDQVFCLSLVVTLKMISDPERKELIKLQLQQSFYNCLYGPDPSQSTHNPVPQQNSNYSTYHGNTYTSIKYLMFQQPISCLSKLLFTPITSLLFSKMKKILKYI